MRLNTTGKWLIVIAVATVIGMALVVGCPELRSEVNAVLRVLLRAL